MFRRLFLSLFLGAIIGVGYVLLTAPVAAMGPGECEDDSCQCECGAGGCVEQCLNSPEKQCAGGGIDCIDVWCPA